jgi:hypothetical protein
MPGNDGQIYLDILPLLLAPMLVILDHLEQLFAETLPEIVELAFRC